MMMILGMFVFSLKKITYQNLNQKTQWRHATNSRIGTLPAYQFLGRGDNTLTLSGTLYPGFKGSPKSLVQLSNMADKGKAYPLIGGNRRVYGQYVIESLEETQTVFFKDGTPRRIDFVLELRQVTTPYALKMTLAKRAVVHAYEIAKAHGVNTEMIDILNTAWGNPLGLEEPYSSPSDTTEDQPSNDKT